MSTSHYRQRLRHHRQALRSHELTPEFIKQNPAASRLYVIYGGTVEERIQQVARHGAVKGARLMRSERRGQKLMQRAKEFMEAHKAEQRRRIAAKAESAQLKQQQADHRSAQRQMTRKGIA